MTQKQIDAMMNACKPKTKRIAKPTISKPAMVIMTDNAPTVSHSQTPAETQAIYEHNLEAQVQWDNRTKTVSEILHTVRQDYAYFTALRSDKPDGMSDLEFNILRYGPLTRLQRKLRLELDALGLSDNEHVCRADRGLGNGRTNDYKLLLRQARNYDALSL